LIGALDTVPGNPPTAGRLKIPSSTRSAFSRKSKLIAILSQLIHRAPIISPHAAYVRHWRRLRRHRRNSCHWRWGRLGLIIMPKRDDQPRYGSEYSAYGSKDTGKGLPPTLLLGLFWHGFTLSRPTSMHVTFGSIQSGKEADIAALFHQNRACSRAG